MIGDETLSYFESAVNAATCPIKIQETTLLSDNLKAKFLSYPIPKAIVEEWEKVK